MASLTRMINWTALVAGTGLFLMFQGEVDLPLRIAGATVLLAALRRIKVQGFAEFILHSRTRRALLPARPFLRRAVSHLVLAVPRGRLVMGMSAERSITHRKRRAHA